MCCHPNVCVATPFLRMNLNPKYPFFLLVWSDAIQISPTAHNSIPASLIAGNPALFPNFNKSHLTRFQQEKMGHWKFEIKVIRGFYLANLGFPKFTFLSIGICSRCISTATNLAEGAVCAAISPLCLICSIIPGKKTQCTVHCLLYLVYFLLCWKIFWWLVCPISL